MLTFAARNTASRKAEIAHQFVEPREPRDKFPTLLTGEFHEQDRFGLSFQEPLHDRAVSGIAPRQVDHRAVDQFHRVRVELDDVL